MTATPGTMERRLGDARLWSTTPAAEPPGTPQAPVLLVHGGYHGAWCWSDWVARLAQDGRVVHAIDLRGHGGLAQPPGFVEAGFNDMADDAVAAIDAIGAPPILVGHSLGGLIVMLAASRRRVAALLLVCPAPPGNLPSARKVALVPEGAPIPPPSISVACARYAPHLDDVQAAEMAGRLCAESPRLLNERYGLRVPIDPQRLSGVPTLVIEGGRDDPDRHPSGQDKAVADMIGGAHLYFADAPHDLMLGPGWPAWYDAIWSRLDTMV